MEWRWLKAKFSGSWLTIRFPTGLTWFYRLDPGRDPATMIALNGVVREARTGWYLDTVDTVPVRLFGLICRVILPALPALTDES